MGCINAVTLCDFLQLCLFQLSVNMHTYVTRCGLINDQPLLTCYLNRPKGVLLVGAGVHHDRPRNISEIADKNPLPPLT
jgi:hypothetical protein